MPEEDNDHGRAMPTYVAVATVAAAYGHVGSAHLSQAFQNHALEKHFKESYTLFMQNIE